MLFHLGVNAAGYLQDKHVLMFCIVRNDPKVAETTQECETRACWNPKSAGVSLATLI